MSDQIGYPGPHAISLRLLVIVLQRRNIESGLNRLSKQSHCVDCSTSLVGKAKRGRMIHLCNSLMTIVELRLLDLPSHAGCAARDWICRHDVIVNPPESFVFATRACFEPVTCSQRYPLT